MIRITQDKLIKREKRRHEKREKKRKKKKLKKITLLKIRIQKEILLS